MYFFGKIHWDPWGHEAIFEVAMAKFLISSILILNGFSFRIFIILSFDAVWPQRTWPQKGLREFFQKLHFWNQCIPRKKIRYVIASWSTFSLNLFTEEVWRSVLCTHTFILVRYTMALLEISPREPLYVHRLRPFIRSLKSGTFQNLYAYK